MWLIVLYGLLTLTPAAALASLVCLTLGLRRGRFGVLILVPTWLITNPIQVSF